MSYKNEIKIKHLQKLGFVGDLTEIDNMYSGDFFNPYDINYLKLMAYSAKLCKQYSQLSGSISADASIIEKNKVEDKKREIIDKLFPTVKSVISIGNGINVFIGQVDAGEVFVANTNVKFSPYTLIKAKDYLLFGPNSRVGNADIHKKDNFIKLGQINFSNDNWVCIDCVIANGASFGDGVIVGLGSNVEKGSHFEKDYIIGGNPAKNLKKITTSSQISTGTTILKREEIDFLVDRMRVLGFESSIEGYLKILNCEEHNILDQNVAKLFDYSHDLTSEYHHNATSLQRKNDIIDLLFPLRGKNFEIQEGFTVDIMGTCKVGDNVKIGKRFDVSGLATVGNNVTIGNNVTMYAMGHRIQAKERKILEVDGNPVFYNNPSTIIVNNDVTIGNNVKLAPFSQVRNDVNNNKVYLKNDKEIDWHI